MISSQGTHQFGIPTPAQGIAFHPHHGQNATCLHKSNFCHSPWDGQNTAKPAVVVERLTHWRYLQISTTSTGEPDFNHQQYQHKPLMRWFGIGFQASFGRRFQQSFQTPVFREGRFLPGKVLFREACGEAMIPKQSDPPVSPPGLKPALRQW